MSDNPQIVSVEKTVKTFTILQMTSASISVLASAALIFMIFRSHKKLSTPLHRLLLGLSICDFIASLALSFGSTLSPPDHIGWHASGNMTLCRMQGFIHFCSQNASPLYNCSLCLYYLIEIKYTSLQQYLAKIEVCLHVMPFLLALIFGIMILSMDEFQPAWTSCHVVSVHPIECRFDPEVECEGGLKDHRTFTYVYTFVFMVIVPLTIIVSMSMIYREVSAQEERSHRHAFSFTTTGQGSSSALRNKIAARNRALAYSLAWLLSWITSLIIIVYRSRSLGEEGEMEIGSLMMPYPLGLVHYSLFALQGLFNFIVYIFPKVTRRLGQYKREGVGNPKRFVLAFYESVISRGEAESRSLRRRSSLLNQNRERRTLSMTQRSEGCPTPSSRRGSNFDRSFMADNLLKEGEHEEEEAKDELKSPIVTEDELPQITVPNDLDRGFDAAHGINFEKVAQKDEDSKYERRSTTEQGGLREFITPEDLDQDCDIIAPREICDVTEAKDTKKANNFLFDKAFEDDEDDDERLRSP